MNWDYRVIEHHGAFTIHEVQYNEKGEIVSVSGDPMGPSGETLEELKTDMDYFLQAFEKPVIRKEDLELEEIGEGEGDECI